LTFLSLSKLERAFTRWKRRSRERSKIAPARFLSSPRDLIDIYSLSLSLSFFFFFFFFFFARDSILERAERRTIKDVVGRRKKLARRE
jgi:hypothetical protein